LRGGQYVLIKLLRPQIPAEAFKDPKFVVTPAKMLVRRIVVAGEEGVPTAPRTPLPSPLSQLSSLPQRSAGGLSSAGLPLLKMLLDKCLSYSTHLIHTSDSAADSKAAAVVEQSAGAALRLLQTLQAALVSRASTSTPISASAKRTAIAAPFYLTVEYAEALMEGAAKLMTSFSAALQSLAAQPQAVRCLSSVSVGLSLCE
jgi:hypothetical protein